MTNNILLTPELKMAMPKTIKVLANFGEISVVFPADNDSEGHMMEGDNAVVEGSEEDFIKWLKPFDGFAVGVGGSPQFEQFEIRHIAKDL
jgi:hypothetical protein